MGLSSLCHLISHAIPSSALPHTSSSHTPLNPHVHNTPLFFPHTSQPPMYKTHLSSSHTLLNPPCTKHTSLLHTHLSTPHVQNTPLSFTHTSQPPMYKTH